MAVLKGRSQPDMVCSTSIRPIYTGSHTLDDAFVLHAYIAMLYFAALGDWEKGGRCYDF